MKSQLLANVGAQAVTDEINALAAVAVAVVTAAVLLVVIPWGAKLAHRIFISMDGGKGFGVGGERTRGSVERQISRVGSPSNKAGNKQRSRIARGGGFGNKRHF